MTSPARTPQTGGPEPAKLDTGRPRLVLPRYLVPVGLFLLERRDLPADHDLRTEVAELEHAGIVRSGALHPLARRILAPIADPSVVISTETSGVPVPEISTVWRAGSSATLGFSTDHVVFELRPVDAGLLPFDLAAILHLHDEPEPDEGIIAIAADLLESAARSTSEGASGMSRELHDRGIGARQSELLARLHTAPSRRWRMSALRTERDGTVGDRGIAVIDGGDLGYWEVGKASGGHRIVFAPRSTAAVLRLIAELT